MINYFCKKPLWECSAKLSLVAVQDITGDGLVLMGKKAAISSAKDVTVESDNVMKQYGVVYGAGEAGTLWSRL